MTEHGYQEMLKHIGEHNFGSALAVCLFMGLGLAILIIMTGVLHDKLNVMKAQISEAMEVMKNATGKQEFHKEFHYVQEIKDGSEKTTGNNPPNRKGKVSFQQKGKRGGNSDVPKRNGEKSAFELGGNAKTT